MTTAIVIACTSIGLFAWVLVGALLVGVAERRTGIFDSWWCLAAMFWPISPIIALVAGMWKLCSMVYGYGKRCPTPNPVRLPVATVRKSGSEP